MFSTPAAGEQVKVATDSGFHELLTRSVPRATPSLSLGFAGGTQKSRPTGPTLSYLLVVSRWTDPAQTPTSVTARLLVPRLGLARQGQHVTTGASPAPRREPRLPAFLFSYHFPTGSKSVSRLTSSKILIPTSLPGMLSPVTRRPCCQCSAVPAAKEGHFQPRSLISRHTFSRVAPSRALSNPSKQVNKRASFLFLFLQFGATPLPPSLINQNLPQSLKNSMSHFFTFLHHHPCSHTHAPHYTQEVPCSRFCLWSTLRNQKLFTHRPPLS